MRTIERVFDGGEMWFRVRDDGTTLMDCATIQEAADYGAGNGYSQEYRMIETEEPLFLVRDDSGRCIAEPVLYTQFDTDERDYFNREDDDNCDEFTFGEWLDDCSVGDEYKNEECNLTVIRTR